MARRNSHMCEKFQTALDLLGKRWMGHIVTALKSGPRRFSELKAELEVIGDRMISERLKELEECGIVTRRVIAEPVVRVEYELTEKGQALERVFASLSGWAEDWVELPRAQKTARGR